MQFNSTLSPLSHFSVMFFGFLSLRHGYSALTFLPHLHHKLIPPLTLIILFCLSSTTYFRCFCFLPQTLVILSPSSTYFYIGSHRSIKPKPSSHFRTTKWLPSPSMKMILLVIFQTLMKKID